MKQDVSLILVIFLTLTISSVSGKVVDMKQHSNYRRYNISAKKNQLKILRYPSYVDITTLSYPLLNSLKAELVKEKNAYIRKVDVMDENFPKEVGKVRIHLTDKTQSFNFYNKGGEKFVVDFWRDPKIVNQKIRRKPRKKKIKTIVRKKVAKKYIPIFTRPLKNENALRDFRYGAAIFWEYTPLIPELKNKLVLESKTAEYFYPVKNVDVEKGEHYIHLQLAINLYRKKKWGLMAKALELFEKKYGNLERDLVLYMRANSIIRTNLGKNERSLEVMSQRLYNDIIEETKNYPLKKGVLLYLIYYTINRTDYVQALDYSKKLFAFAKEDFDIETEKKSSEFILHILSLLLQASKVDKFLSNKKIKELLPQQVIMAYQSYAWIRQNKTSTLIRGHEKGLWSIVEPWDRSYLFNLAEAYFREADFETAIKYFDKYLENYSHTPYAGKAMLRIALSYDLLDREFKKIAELYRRVINRSMDNDVSFEARLRYVGIVHLRQKHIPQVSEEAKVLLTSNEVSKGVSKNNKWLLWLIRLRIFINEKNYEDALKYLKVLPLYTMLPHMRRVFESDGAEIIYGLIKNYYIKKDYGNLIYYWEKYKKTYIHKIAANPLVNFYATSAYMNLNLHESYKRTLGEMKKLKNEYPKSYPTWIDLKNTNSLNTLIAKLDLDYAFMEKNFELAGKIIKEHPQFSQGVRGLYLKGRVEYHQGNYDKSKIILEKLFAGSENTNNLVESEIFDAFQIYLDSLVALEKYDIYEKNYEAILKDVQNIKENKKFLEEVEYQHVEVLYDQKKYLLVESLASKYIKNFPENFYNSRVRYLLGVSLIKNKREKKGRVIFEKIVSDEKIPAYIRELARSELTTLNIKRMKSRQEV